MLKRLIRLDSNRRAGGIRLSFALGSLLLFLLCIPVFAEWQKDYENAMDLIKKNQWEAAIPKLQSAIRDKNEEGSNIKFYGMKFNDYFPHFYLGVGLFQPEELCTSDE